MSAEPAGGCAQGMHEVSETFELSSMANIEEAVNQITAFLGMAPCEKSNRIKPEKSTHTLYLSGVYSGGHPVLAVAKLAQDEGVTLQLTVRSSDESTCALVSSAVGG
jgi:coatomer subunit gamma